MPHTQRCFLASGCSTYRTYALRAPRIENPTVHGTSPPSRRRLVRYAGWLLDRNESTGWRRGYQVAGRKMRLQEFGELRPFAPDHFRPGETIVEICP